jgi:ribosomal protein L37AE/L43A
MLLFNHDMKLSEQKQSKQDGCSHCGSLSYTKRGSFFKCAHCGASLEGDEKIAGTIAHFLKTEKKS